MRAAVDPSGKRLGTALDRWGGEAGGKTGAPSLGV